MWNSLNTRVDCDYENNNVSDQSAIKSQQKPERCELSVSSESQTCDVRRRRANGTKCKGKIDGIKQKEVVRLLAAKFSGLRPFLSSKIEKMEAKSEKNKTNGVLISSSDVRWTTQNRIRMKDKLKIKIVM